MESLFPMDNFSILIQIFISHITSILHNIACVTYVSQVNMSKVKVTFRKMVKAD